MSNGLLLSIAIPFIFGAISFLLPKKDNKIAPYLALIISCTTFLFCIDIFRSKPIALSYFSQSFFLVDNLSGFITLFIGLFSFLIVLYSLGFMKEKGNLNKYYAYILWTIAASIGAATSDNLILFMVFWGILGVTLYLLIAMGGPEARGPAKKTFIIIGGSDALILLGIAIIWKLQSILAMSQINIALQNNLAIWAFVCLALGAFAKAGAMPLHTWIPDSASSAPTPVMAFLPASLDKLLGIYLLARISLDMFIIEPGSSISLFLLIIGAVTIVAAVMMALVQHNFKRLLSYHAVSQVGYMVLGIGTGNPIGIAGGLFHMVNHAIYKSCLFLSGGNVEHRMQTDDLTKLGGLAKYMPITFVTFLIASFSISGIPPFNGFVSKWMVYQGIIDLGKSGSPLWVVWIVAAMFGSALTLASFMKLIHAIFLGQSSRDRVGSLKDVPAIMLASPIILAVLCVVFGVFAFQLPIKLFILPSLGVNLDFSGVWNASVATVLILVGFFVGLIIYLLGNIKIREVRPFIGGENIDHQKDMRPSGAEFYNTVKEIGLLKVIYSLAEKKMFDLYEVLKNIFAYFTEMLRALHTGILLTYLLWVLIGLVVLSYLFIKI